jgi:hypothetical protein
LFTIQTEKTGEEEEEEETKSEARPLKSTSLSPWLPSSNARPLICFYVEEKCKRDFST